MEQSSTSSSSGRLEPIRKEPIHTEAVSTEQVEPIRLAEVIPISAGIDVRQSGEVYLPIELTYPLWQLGAKRTIDIFGTVLLFALLVPIMLTAVAAIIIEGLFSANARGPIIFRQKRVGRDGVLINFAKFRSMVRDAEAIRPSLLQFSDRQGLFKMVKDPRITRVGAFLRKTSIDELPQLWSVLRGDMSLVGPRPHLPDEVATYKDHMRIVLSVKPGLTGMAQVHGRADNDLPQENRWDALYVRRWSIWLDILILWKTVGVVLSRRGAR